MKKTCTMPRDPTEYLETEEDIVAYLNIALEASDLSLIMAILGNIARVHGMSVAAHEKGLTAFSSDSASQLSESIC